MAEVMPHVPATGSRSWANADWRAGEARQDEMRAEFGNTLANGGGSDGEEPMCPGCAKWASQRSESMAEAGRLIELLRARASQESRGANLAWGLAASGWLLLAAAVARLVARFTSAEWTPATRESAFSMRATHEAQVMPVTGRVISAMGLLGSMGTGSVDILRGSIRPPPFPSRPVGCPHADLHLVESLGSAPRRGGERPHLRDRPRPPRADCADRRRWGRPSRGRSHRRCA